jgi:16S rRNA (uracil1498-N3)-methyltransferase
MSERFFLAVAPRGPTASLVGDEARHLARVLRAKVGETVRVFDGSGTEWPARIDSIGRDRVDLILGEPFVQTETSGRSLTLAVALPKGDRQKWMVEKLTELGVARLVPLVTSRGVAEATPAAIERLKRSVIEACKQCGRSTLLEIAEPRPLAACVAEKPPGSPGLVADPGGIPVADAVYSASAKQGADMIALVGPEGGFTDEEFAAAVEAGFTAVSLGRHVLRIETAAIAVAAVVAATRRPPTLPDR